jgi:LuxR family maltose regulon positive regulatory protein
MDPEGRHVEDVLALLEQGRRGEAGQLLLERLTRAGDAEAADADRGHETSTADAVAFALRTLEHVRAGSAALRSGRVNELVSEARSAAEATPRALPWVVFRVGSLFQAAYRFTGDATLREEALRICGLVGDRLDLPHLAVQARALMGNIHMMRGALHRALEHCDAALALAAAAETHDAASAAMAHQFRAYVLFEWNRLDEAETALRRAWHLTPRRGVRSGVARTMAHLSWVRGDHDGVQTWLTRLEAIVSEPLTMRNREWLAAVRLRLSLGMADRRPMAAWLRAYDYHPSTLLALDAPALLARLHELEQVMALLEATARWFELLDVAPPILAATRHERRWFAARAATAQAVALEALGRAREADDALDEALTLGAEGSFVRAYLEGSAHRAVLLARAARRRGRKAARRVLEAAPELDRQASRPLTPAQVAVLKRVAAGGSNKTIAREMGLAVSTVKTHLRAVFARLEVSSRTQAVARARDQGWL